MKTIPRIPPVSRRKFATWFDHMIKSATDGSDELIWLETGVTFVRATKAEIVDLALCDGVFTIAWWDSMDRDCRLGVVESKDSATVGGFLAHLLYS